MNIKNLSYATVKRLKEKGYLKSIPDLYKLQKKRKELENMSNFGEKSINKILKEIDDHKTVKDYILFGSLGIESIGERIFKKILGVIPYNDIIKYAEAEDNDKFLMPGIKLKTAAKICDGINSRVTIIKKLLKYIKLEETEIGGDEPLFSVCFTSIKTEDKDIKEAIEKYIEELGGEVVDNVTKKTNVLVVPTLDESSEDYKFSSKMKDAQNKGITMVPIIDAKSYIETKFK